MSFTLSVLTLNEPAGGDRWPGSLISLLHALFYLSRSSFLTFSSILRDDYNFVDVKIGYTDISKVFK